MENVNRLAKKGGKVGNRKTKTDMNGDQRMERNNVFLNISNFFYH